MRKMLTVYCELDLEAKVFWGKTGDLLESPPPNQVFGPARDVFGARLGSRTQPSC